MSACGMKTEVYSRVCGYYRPVANWNKGKQEEFNERVEFDVKQAGDKSKDSQSTKLV